MIDRSQITRRDTLAAIAGGGALLGVGAVSLAGAQETTERTLPWTGQGDENAELECEPEDTGVWKWILTRGGPIPIGADPELTVTFADGTVITETGFFPGSPLGSAHFEVERPTGGEVVSASVTFSGGGTRALLTISDSWCRNGDPPGREPLLVSTECVKHRGQILVENPNDLAVTVTVTGPDEYEESQTVEPGGTIIFDRLVDGIYELETDPADIGVDQTSTVEILCTVDEPTDLRVSHRCVDGRGQITISNPNQFPVDVTVTGPEDFEELLEFEAGQTLYLGDLADGTYELSVEDAKVDIDPTTVEIDCPECIPISLDLAEQYQQLLDIPLTNPFTVEVQLATAVTDAVTLDVSVTNHHGEFQETPTTSLSGDTTVDFEEGVGRFTIGAPGTEADLTLIPLEENGVTFDDINDVENIAVQTEHEVAGLAVCPL